MFGLLAIAGCTTLGPWPDTGTDDVDEPHSRIVASPALIDFGPLSVQDASSFSGTVILYNLGNTDEAVTGHDEPIGSDAFHVDAPPVLLMAPGETVELAVTYHPLTEQSDAAELLLSPSEETVRLLGVATAPVLEAARPHVDGVVVGCTGAGRIDLANVGSETLIVHGASIEHEEFDVVTVPDTISAGMSAAIELSFTPGGGGPRYSTLTLSTNDPLRPDIGIIVTGNGSAGPIVTESFRYTPSNPTDLLFVVGTGSGMTGHVAKALDVIPDFVDALRDTNIDYHVTTLSEGSPCPAVTPGWAERADTRLQTEAVLERGFLGTSVGDDNLLDLAVEALEHAGPGGCLEGYRREEADLHVIVVTDQPSRTDVARAEALLVAGVAAPAELRVSALVPTTPTCGTVAADYAGVAERHGGAASDLCATDWTDAFEGFATVPPGHESVRYPLAEVPVPSTIEVRAEGVPFAGWTYDQVDNTVVFGEDAAPALGAEITVDYVSSVSCAVIHASDGTAP